MNVEMILGIGCFIITLPFMLWELCALIKGEEIPITFIGVVLAFIFGSYTIGKDVLPFIISTTKNAKGVVREISFPEGCVKSFEYEGHTYCICVRDNIESYQDAERLCEEYGGHLAVINNKEENKYLYDYCIKESGYHSAYFGYTDSETEGKWKWVDGSSSGQDGVFTNWKRDPLQPDNGGVSDGLDGEEDYALFWHLDPEYTWNDGDFGKDKGTQTVIFLIEWDYVSEH